MKDLNEIINEDYIPVTGLWDYATRNYGLIKKGVNTLIGNKGFNLKGLQNRKEVKNTLERTAFLGLCNIIYLDVFYNFLEMITD
ncbi:MAG: hypothetical protein V1859_00135 [archaeon]